MSKENNSRQPRFSFVAQSDNTKVKRPVVSTPIQRTLKPGEYRIKINGKTLVVKPTQTTLRQDNRGQYQRNEDQKRSKVLRKQYEEEKNKEEAMKTVGALPTLTLPSTYIGPLFNGNRKSYMDNLMSGEGTGDADANLAIDIATPVVISGAGKAARVVSTNIGRTPMRATGANSISKSFADPNDGLPWALKGGKWDQYEINKQAREGVIDLRNWVTNKSFIDNQELNKEAARRLGLEYVPIWERPEAIKQLNRYGTNGTIVQRVDPNRPLGWVENPIGSGYTKEYSHVANINLASPFPYSESIIHEGGHTLGMGGPYSKKNLSPKDQMKSSDKQELYLERKSKQILNPGYKYEGYDLSLFPYEAVQNIRDIGRSLGLAVGQEYPGYDKALQILRNKDLIENSAKREIAGYLKTDKKSMPRVWKALTGTFFGMPTAITIGHNE